MMESLRNSFGYQFIPEFYKNLGKDNLLWVKSLVMSIYLLNVFNGLHVLLAKLTQDYFSVDDTDFLKKMIIANYLLKSR